MFCVFSKRLEAIRTLSQKRIMLNLVLPFITDNEANSLSLDSTGSKKCYFTL